MTLKFSMYDGTKILKPILDDQIFKIIVEYSFSWLILLPLSYL